MTGPRWVLAVRRRERDRWPDEPKETYEPVERDRDGRFDDRPRHRDEDEPDGA